MGDINLKIIKKQINLGLRPSLIIIKDKSNKIYSNNQPIINYCQNNISYFPLLVSDERLLECNELNLFLIQRFTGEYSLKQNRNRISETVFSKGYIASLKGEPLSLKTVESIAKDLKAFLQFVIENNYDYLEVIATPLTLNSSSDALSSLPIWQYHANLCRKVKANELSWSVANRRISRVREFYIWSYKRGTLSSLPFSLDLKMICKSSTSQAEDLLFSLPTAESKQSPNGVMAWVSNLRIPKTIKQKQPYHKHLQPYNSEELVSLFSTQVFLKGGTYSLFLKCAYLGGFRSFEIVNLNFTDISNPDETKNETQKLYIVNIVRKMHRPKNINVTSTLMRLLYEYTQTNIWKTRRKIHETKYGINNPEHPLPLFINSSGERMSINTPSSSIAEVRKEQKKIGAKVLPRSFHDLRSTFGTYLAIFLISKNNDIRRVRSELSKWMGHEKFSTTESYINFAKCSDPDTHGSMNDWVEDVYSHIKKLKTGKSDE